MNTWRLVSREIAHRKLSFAFGVFSVAIAAASLVAQLTLIRGHDIRTTELLADKEAQLNKRLDSDRAETAKLLADKEEQVYARLARRRAETVQLLAAEEKEIDERLTKLRDEFRKLTLKLGFNVRILPEGQDLGEFYAEGFAQKTMDEEFVHRLSESKLLTSIRHLLPKLERKIEWPERGRKIILLGTHGEVPIRERTDPKKPIIKIIPDGQLDVGHELWKSLKLKPGDKITLLGEEFTIRKCYKEQGSRADITIYIDLRKAQQLLKMPGLINEIQAVDCRCAWADIGKIRAELAKILPKTQAIVTLKQAVVRKRARVKAEEESKLALEQKHAAKTRLLEQQEEDSKRALGQERAAKTSLLEQQEEDSKQALEDERAAAARLQGQRKAFAAITVPVIAVVCALWVGLLAFGNVRERSHEIGILRAIGCRAGQIFTIFISRAVLIGSIGACVGCLVGFVVGITRGNQAHPVAVEALFSPALLAVVLVAAPLLAVLAAWLPARAGARQDPALVLREK